MRPRIYLLGDSITEESFTEGGWGATLANHFCRMVFSHVKFEAFENGVVDDGDVLFCILQVDVVLRGYSGYNTRWALKVLEKVFPEAPPPQGDGGAPVAAVTVFFGANDATLPDRCSGFQHVPLNEYKHNLHSIVSFFKKLWPKAIVLLITPPPIDEVARLQYPYTDNPQGLPERTNEAAGEYAKACTAVAAECGVPVIDLWTKMQQCPDWKKEYLSDGLHLTKKGNQVVFDEVVAKLRDEGVSVESMTAELPLIADINPNDPLKAFQ
ncbi:GDSL esterase/lipase At5g45920 isoform X1 [Arachis duranensis]|uniref:GDSL esterase/lipase At5g45920 isoform X1 n=1 Tax=Arachis duranensis TaxID=130453 RepID=A0A9C6TDN8_ARADU|nr:GDSL esterase/lipase At5g45920 isoform X1 [Arachis hypogaea]XP_052114660.1 GDSL esterase/lipase At5g45920 isoform X1 [Arachis duranensis]